MSALPVFPADVLSWHERRAAQEADRRQVMADAQPGPGTFADLNDLFGGFRSAAQNAPPLLAWRAIDDYPDNCVSTVIATRKHGDADWMLLSGLWRHTPGGWREEMCNAPLPQPTGWDYRWMDELALIALLPTAAREVTS